MPNIISSLTNSAKIASLYVGYYSRAADPAGFNFWLGVLNSGSLNINQIAADYATQPESTQNYPYLADPASASPTAFVSQVFANVFNRAPDPAGLSFWSTQLSNGYPVGEFILAIMDGAQNTADLQDETILRNKIALAEYWKDKAEATPGFSMAIDSPERAEAVRVMRGVGATSASLFLARAETDAYFANY